MEMLGNNELLLGIMCLVIGVLDLLVVRRMVLSNYKKNMESDSNYTIIEKEDALKRIATYINISGIAFIILGLYFLYQLIE
jgi:uncharacterized membrane protein HdeD (DUF308 family)